MNKSYLLSVEDDKNDILFMEYVLSEISLNIKFEFILDGLSALKFFQSEKFKNDPPKIILLDIKLPGITGLELLKKYRELKEVPQVPVIMLSSSDRLDEIALSYELGANSYVEKPRDIDNLREKLGLLLEYWVKVNKNSF